MITETNTTELKRIPFGARLQAARESLGLESKDAAAQLRLNEEIILMMEKDCYSSDLPAIFLRGYLRSYGKLLQIPEHEIKLAIEPIQPKPAVQPETVTSKPTQPLTSGNYFIQIFTYLIVFTLIGLVAIWWYTHTGTTTQPATAENQLSLPVEKLDVPVKAEAAASISLGAKLSDSAQPSLASPPSAAPIATSLPVKKNEPAAAKTKAPVRDISETESETDENNNTESNNDTAD